MQLAIAGDRLILTLEGLERLWAFKLSPIAIDRADVELATAALPPSDWKALRAPGTFVPGLIKAGTYYTSRGKEFWYVVRGRKDDPLTIELRGPSYRRLALTLEDAARWAERINAWASG